jgi:hypothetical protein
MLQPAVVTATVGVQGQGIEATLGEATLGRSIPAFGPLMTLHVRLGEGTLAPFSSVRVSYLPLTPFDEVDVDDQGEAIAGSGRDLGLHGPWQLDAATGFSFGFSP